MRAVKMLGVSLVAMIGVTMAGGPSAWAEPTALCKEDVEVCPESSVIEHIHAATVEPAKMLSPVVNFECDILSLGDVEGEALASPVVFVGQNTYSNCTGGCTVIHITEVGVIEVLKTGHETAELTGESELLIHCGAFVHCTYNGEGAEGTGFGPLLSVYKNGDVTVVERELHRVKGLFCPNEARVDFSSTALEPIYITN